jgi:glutaredoxin
MADESIGVHTNSPRVVVYSKPDCVDCFNAKRFLTNRQVDFVVRNMVDEAVINEVLDWLGPGKFATPIIAVDDHAFSGFAVNREHLTNVLIQLGLMAATRSVA